MPTHIPALLQTLQNAITTQTVVQLTYSSANGAYSERALEPLALYHTSNTDWMLIAWCRQRKDYREFRLDRMQQLTGSDEAYPPRFFRLERYFARR